MPPPYDAVVTIGGQSFADGLWRLLGPALEGLTNPLPLALPGFANAQMRVTQLVPVIPGSPPATGALILRAGVEVTGELLLHVLTQSGTASVTLGSQDFTLADLAGSIELPARTGSLTNIAVSGTLGSLTGGTGDIDLDAETTTLSGGTGTGTLDLPGSVTVPGLPLPAVVPVAVDLTNGAMPLQATVVLSVSGPNAATRFGLRFAVTDVTVSALGGAIPAATLTTTLQNAVNQIVGQLASPIAPPAVSGTLIGALIAPIPNIVAAAFDEALTNLLAETGRLVYPAPGAGASCDTRVLPTAADATLTAASDGSLVLQIGFQRAGSTDITTLPSTAGPVECDIRVGNSFVLSLMCCLVERLPNFALPMAAVTSTTDVNGATHTSCCNFTGVTANFGGIAIGGGGLSVCIDGASGGPKTFSLVGGFGQTIGITVPIPFGGGAAPLGMIGIAATFSLPLGFDLDDAAALANLRLGGPPIVAASVTLGIVPATLLALILVVLIPIALVVSGLLAPIGAMIGAVMGAVVVLIVLLLVLLACTIASTLLDNAVRTLLAGASLLRSPVALPPGLFEAFGRFSPATVAVDDLTADGVLHTPTSVWGLLPRLGAQRSRPVPIDPDKFETFDPRDLPPLNPEGEQPASPNDARLVGPGDVRTADLENVRRDDEPPDRTKA